MKSGNRIKKSVHKQSKGLPGATEKRKKKKTKKIAWGWKEDVGERDRGEEHKTSEAGECEVAC